MAGAWVELRDRIATLMIDLMQALRWG